MLNPIQLTRLAGLALAVSLTASCGVETTSEITPADVSTGTPEGGTKGAPESGTANTAAASDAGTAKAGSGGAGEPAKLTPVAEAETPVADTPEPEAPAAPAGDVSTWKVGSTIPSRVAAANIEIVELVKNGSGPVCGLGKNATVKYKAMLGDGTVKDPGARPYTFQVGPGGVIQPWHTIVAKMRVGDSFTVLIPEVIMNTQGPRYGNQGDWKFEMELLSFK